MILQGGLWVTVFCLLVLLAEGTERAEKRRSKRIIGGEVILQRNSGVYRSVKYLVVIANQHACKKTEANGHANPSFTCSVHPDYVFCSGSLLTLRIVQTACHCVANFSSKAIYDLSPPDVKVPLTPAIRRGDDWEDSYFIFPGQSKLQSMTDGLRSAKKYFHPKCAKMALHPRGWLTHDSGLILLEGSVEEGVFADRNKYRIRYADLFSQEDLIKQWEDSMFRLPTCLGVGFGQVDRIATSRSLQLRHSWSVLLEYWMCYFYSMGTTSFEKVYDYTEVGTWGCTMNMLNKTSYMTKYDDGGPISCNDYHYGTFLLSFNPEAGRYIQMIMPIAFTIYENSVEHRLSMIESVCTWRDKTYTFRPKTSLDRVTRLDLYEQFSASMSVPRIIAKLEFVAAVVILLNFQYPL